MSYPQPPATPAPQKTSGAKIAAFGCGGLVLFVILIGVIGAALGLGKSTNTSASSNDSNPNVGTSTTKVITSSPTAAATTTAPKPTPTKADPKLATALAISKWWNGGGSDKATAIETDFGSIGTDSNNQDINAVGNDCTNLSGDVTDAQGYKPIPDRQAQSHWHAALSDFSNAASDCLAGIAANDASLVVKASKEIAAGSAQLNQTTARIREFANL